MAMSTVPERTVSGMSSSRAHLLIRLRAPGVTSIIGTKMHETFLSGVTDKKTIAGLARSLVLLLLAPAAAERGLLSRHK